MSGSIPKGGRKQYLDRLPVERARGITVKAQSVSLLHDHPENGKKYLLNLIDTPGHADFSFEVSRSLAACEGAILLVDATQAGPAAPRSMIKQTVATIRPVVSRANAYVDPVTPLNTKPYPSRNPKP